MLVGFPVRQFQIAQKPSTLKPGQTPQTKWVDEVALEQYLNAGFVATGKKQMSYAAPEWIANKENGGILLLDDWNRAD
jgi:hypothetical protein